ncbi:hypothetical protein ANN_15528 [Periplaneta americana]|uniref:Sodium/solute symporter n=1 Tax=Periplaneta americana TaxID=6978 RepID=A0ABQ8SGL3_PERAM|nr:hypothetical protein ANN_15528 [Periplaneta americana]
MTASFNGWGNHRANPTILSFWLDDRPPLLRYMDGGIKAVVWTDFLQGMVMVVASFAVITLGLIHVGGFGIVWQRSLEGGRIKVFEMDPSPFERMTFWSILIGGTSGWLGSLSVNQASIQRFMSLPSYSKVQKSLAFLVLGTLFIKCITCFMGLVMYATYYDCDPLKTKVITRSDQLIAYYVVDIASAIPGLPGLFVAGIFSAALSTMSTTLNSLGATLFEDFVRPCLKVKISDKTSNNIIKLLIIIIGGVCVVMVFLVDKIGGVVQGAIAGSITSLFFMGWMMFGTQKSLADGTLKYPKLPTNTDGCGINITEPVLLPTDAPKEEAFVLFRITFLYYTVIGFFVMITVATIVSHFTEAPNMAEMNLKLFSPVIRKKILRRRRKCEMKVLEEKDALFTSAAD